MTEAASRADSNLAPLAIQARDIPVCPNGYQATPLGQERQTIPQFKHTIADASRPTSAGLTDHGNRLRILTNNIDRDPNATSGENVPDGPWMVGTDDGIDPLSRHIIKRTNTLQPPAPLIKRHSEGSSSIAGVADDQSGKPSPDEARDVDGVGARRDKKKGVSFLSRFIGNKKREQQEEPTVEKLEIRDDRPEGAEVEVFSQFVDNVGFNPRHPQPPAYIKVRSQAKKEKDFNRVFLAQELHDHMPVDPELLRTATGPNKLRKARKTTTEATWAMEFSTDGKYLATGGQDKIVRVWAVLSSPEDRQMHEKDEEADEAVHGENMRLSAPVFRKKPIQRYEGHTSPVLDLSWSKNSFLLSSSMDKTVRLWHISRKECLCAFKHSDFVTSIQFHPKDDRFFLAGSLDSKLRLWSIPDKSVAFWNQIPDMITAVAFLPDGKTAIAGCVSGLCLFYDTDGLKYQTQIHVRSAHGKNAKGSKITGIHTINMPPSDLNGDVKVLITSNDSRVRMYNFRDKSLEMKFKGNENVSSQIHARFSDDARYVICGSEDKRVFIWDVKCSDVDRKDKKPVEAFEAHNAAATVSLLAPSRTRQLLSSSGDPVYDICNPPPITLISRAEREFQLLVPFETRNSAMNSQTALAPVADGAGLSASKNNIATTTTTNNAPVTRATTSPAYISRTHHPNGNIIVTTDSTGLIKVFRQDCAHGKRLAWDSLSGLSRKDVGSQRSRESRRGSTASTQNTQPPGERILSWRRSISDPDRRASSRDRTASSLADTGRRANRSVSPLEPPPRSSSQAGGSGTPPSIIHTDSATSSHQYKQGDAESLSHFPSYQEDNVLENLRPTHAHAHFSVATSSSPTHPGLLEYSTHKV